MSTGSLIAAVVIVVSSCGALVWALLELHRIERDGRE